MSTPHNRANLGDIAKTVLMPGDPLRAKYFAELFLDDVKQFNSVRNMFGYTGKYKGKEVSIMGSGMGIPSIGIYSYELFKFYDVDNIIRLGTCGCYSDSENYHLLDTVLISEAFSFSTYALEQNGSADKVIPASPTLLEKLRVSAHSLNLSLPEVRTHSSDVFYYEPEYRQRISNRMCKEYGCDVIECECFALFHNARVTGKSAAGLMSITDRIKFDQHATSVERERGNKQMFEIALGIL